MDKLYIETSIVSYATAWPSRDIAIAGLQQQARDWWATERHAFELVTSQLTLDEAGDGDPTAAADRLKLLSGLPLVDINEDVESLAHRLINRHTHNAGKSNRRRISCCRCRPRGRKISLDAQLSPHCERARASPNLQFATRRGARAIVDL